MKLRVLILINVVLLAWSCGGEATDLAMAEFIGGWEVDLDRTIERAKDSPKYDAANAEDVPETIRKLMSMMKIEISETEIVYLRGAKKQALPYEFKSADPNSVTVTVHNGDEQANLVFSWVDEGRMNFKSSVSDDMNYYVWLRTEG